MRFAGFSHYNLTLKANANVFEKIINLYVLLPDTAVERCKIVLIPLLTARVQQQRWEVKIINKGTLSIPAWLARPIGLYVIVKRSIRVYILWYIYSGSIAGAINAVVTNFWLGSAPPPAFPFPPSLCPFLPCVGPLPHPNSPSSSQRRGSSPGKIWKFLIAVGKL